MSVSVCPHCNVISNAPQSTIGKTIRCAHCMMTFPADQTSSLETPASFSPERLAALDACNMPPQSKPALEAEVPDISKGRTRNTRLRIGLALVSTVVLIGFALWWLFGGNGIDLTAGVPPALAIKPAPLAGDKETRHLRGKAGAVLVGGGGRFLFFHLPAVRQLAVFDVNEAKFVEHLPMAEENVLLAAGGQAHRVPERRQQIPTLGPDQDGT